MDGYVDELELEFTNTIFRTKVPHWNSTGEGTLGKHKRYEGFTLF